MKLILNSLVLYLVFFCFIGIAHSEEICFSSQNASKLVMDLETCKIIQNEELPNLKEQNQLLKEQIDLSKQKIELLEKQIEFSNQTIQQYKELLGLQQKAYEQAMEANKPSVFETILKTIGAVAAGVLVGLAL